jgi:hypothetical protein
MNSRDFGKRLDQAAKDAAELAARQELIAQKLKPENDSGSGNSTQKADQQKPGGKSADKSNGDASAKNGEAKEKTGFDGQQVNPLAREQSSLAQRTRLLADLLDRLRQDATSEGSSVKQQLQQIDSENSPREIAQVMNETADDLASRRTTAANRGASEAKQRLQELSKSLGSAAGEYAQPQLKELMALEEQLAALQQQLKRQHGNREGMATAGEKWRQIETRLDRMSANDQRLAEAMRGLREGDSPREKSASSSKTPPVPGSRLKPAEFTDASNHATPEGFYSWLELGDYSGIKEISKVLQTRIQEAILAGGMMDADQPVPSAYKELVEKYYRTLSDDLR